MVTTTADLNLHPDLNGNVKIFCSQYDNALREIVFNIYDGDTLADLTDLTAKVEGTKPDKYGYSYDATISTSNSTVTVTLVTQMTCVAGLSHAEIVLYDDDSRVGTANFLLMVEEAGISDDTIVSDSVIPGIHNIDTLVEYAQTYADNAEASALKAEGYAAGTQNGTEVESGSEYYEHNAQYYCEHAFSTTPSGYEGVVEQVETNKNNIATNTGAISTLNSSLTNLFYDNAGAHNCIYRGKSLGTSVTSDQHSAISAGTFDDMYIGDYWTINNVVYRIAAFDYWYNTGDTACTTHHAVLVPDSNLYTAQMNSSNTTDGGYIGSEMYTTNLADAITTITNAFGSSYLLSHRNQFVDAVTDGYPSSVDWYDSTVDLMNEEMVFGGKIFEPSANGAAVYANYTNDKSQLPLFQFRHDLIGNRAYWWLRNVVSSSFFANVGGYGGAGANGASYSLGVRPVFAIT